MLHCWDNREAWGALGELVSECSISRGRPNSHPIWEYRMKLPSFQKYLKYGIVIS